MDCPICRDLKRMYEAGVREYIEARSSACFRACTRLAARKNVEMERARDEVEEHRLVGMRLRRQGVCTFAGAGRVYEFETTGCIVSCRFSSAAGPGPAGVAAGSFPG